MWITYPVRRGGGHCPIRDVVRGSQMCSKLIQNVHLLVGKLGKCIQSFGARSAPEKIGIWSLWLGCSPRNGNTRRIKESARIWTDLLERWFRLKYLSFSLNILRVWTVLKNFRCPPKRKSALFIPFCLCICILGVSFWEISDEAFLEHHFRARVSWHKTLALRKWIKLIVWIPFLVGVLKSEFSPWQKGCSISIKNTVKLFKTGI